jgi:hypothetical protein
MSNIIKNAKNITTFLLACFFPGALTALFAAVSEAPMFPCDCVNSYSPALFNDSDPSPAKENALPILTYCLASSKKDERSDDTSVLFLPVSLTIKSNSSSLVCALPG